MDSRSRGFTALSIAVLGALSRLINAQSVSSGGAATRAVLARKRYRTPRAWSIASSPRSRTKPARANSAAPNARATSLVIYANLDGSNKVTLRLDQYGGLHPNEYMAWRFTFE
jgi:hypothetical protein